MSADGTFGFVYCGQIGVGVGVMAIKNNVLKGADLSGGRYSGVVKERPNGDGYTITYDMFVPPTSSRSRAQRHKKWRTHGAASLSTFHRTLITESRSNF